MEENWTRAQVLIPKVQLADNRAVSQVRPYNLGLTASLGTQDLEPLERLTLAHGPPCIWLVLLCRWLNPCSTNWYGLSFSCHPPLTINQVLGSPFLRLILTPITLLSHLSHIHTAHVGSCESVMWRRTNEESEPIARTHKKPQMSGGMCGRRCETHENLGF